MKRMIKSSQSVQADFVVNSPFSNLSIEIMPTNRIKIHNGRHVESLDCKSAKDIPETIYEYLKTLV